MYHFDVNICATQYIINVLAQDVINPNLPLLMHL